MNTRELELKYVLAVPMTNVDLDMTLLQLFGVSGDDYEVGSDLDAYFKAAGVDFVRLRESFNSPEVEMTVKKSDKGNNIDRIENNVLVESFDKGFRLCRTLFGEPLGYLEKTFSKFRLPNGVEVSTYYVEGDSEYRNFIEVEGPDLNQIGLVVEKLRSKLEMVREPRSNYQIFIEKE
jgi:hypothetical protein